VRQYRGGVEQAVRDTFKLLEKQNAILNIGFAVEFPSGRNSVYFVLPAISHECALRRAIDALLGTPMERLFKLHSRYNREG
jgi:hypothetical protein